MSTSTGIETVRHKKKDSTLMWFIIGIIPILDLYFLWKLAELVASHEKFTEIRSEQTS
jgi:hypothetical protein